MAYLSECCHEPVKSKHGTFKCTKCDEISYRPVAVTDDIKPDELEFIKDCEF